MTIGFFQSGGGLGFAYACGQHYESDRGTIAAGFERLGGGFVIRAGGLLEDANRALDELVILRPDVDHVVAIDVAEARHGAGGDHVEIHFMGGAGYHARTSREDFRANFCDDGEVRGTFERGVAIAGERDGASSAAAS